MVEALKFSMRADDTKERFDQYRDIYGLGAETVTLDGPVSTEVEAWRRGGVMLFESRNSGLGADRPASRIRRNPLDHFTLQLNLQGEFHAEGADGFRTVRPGEILLLDMAKPMRTRMPNVHLITLAVSRTVMAAAGAASDDLHGLVIPTDRSAGLSRLLRSFIEPAGSQPLPLGERLTGQLGSALWGMNLARRAGREESDEARLRLAYRFIQDHLWDETLSPIRVAQASGISRATLYRLFDQADGVRKYIQTQRLAQLKRSLGDPYEQRPIAALAFEAGFVSEPHASRSFRQMFGLPPSEFRRELRASARSKFGDLASKVKRNLTAWYSGLNGRWLDV